MKSPGKRQGTLLWVSATTVLAVITLGIMVDLSSPGRIRNVIALIPRNIKTQTISTGGGMNSPTPTGSWHATATVTTLQPATPLPSPTATPPSPTKVPYAGKTILVDISDQHVYAYEKGKLIFSFVASTGRNHSTRAGRYKILDKIPKAYSDPWGFWMPYWMGFEYVGSNLENGFHSLPVLSNGVQIWGKKIGSPITYGCVVLKPNDMKKLYRWAGIGTAVVIRK